MLFSLVIALLFLRLVTSCALHHTRNIAPSERSKTLEFVSTNGRSQFALSEGRRPRNVCIAIAATIDSWVAVLDATFPPFRTVLPVYPADYKPVGGPCCLCFLLHLPVACDFFTFFVGKCSHSPLFDV
uniref:Secreted protein n=1 Tax=Steinernema glaseri TaxID=37863 RepID=A0A1I7YBD9_9BILA